MYVSVSGDEDKWKWDVCAPVGLHGPYHPVLRVFEPPSLPGMTQSQQTAELELVSKDGLGPLA